MAAWLAQEPEVPGLIAAYVAAERDARRAAASLERLTALCRPEAERIARTYARAEADVADLAQEALIVLATCLPQLRQPAAFSHWFATVVHNVCRQWLRRERDRRATASLDGLLASPSRAGRGAGRLELADPRAIAPFAAVETHDALRRLLRLLPGPQRAALTLAHLDDRSYEQIGREIGTSARGAEGLIYRGLQRLQVIASQCTDEPAPLATWCQTCHRPLVGVLVPGDFAHLPLRLRVRCPGHHPPGVWMHTGTVPFGRYSSLDEAWEQGGLLGGRTARRWVRGLQRGQGPRCWRCQVPLVYERHWWTPWWERGGTSHYMLSWQCPTCREPYSPMHVQLGATAAGLLPEWRAFARSAPLRRFLPERIVRDAGEDVLVTSMEDPATGQRATVHVACASLRVRRLELTPR